MTYPNEPGTNPRRYPPPDNGFTGWIIGGVMVVVALAVGLFLYANSNGGTQSAVNTANRPSVGTRVTPTPSTTGSGAVQPTNPVGNVPTEPKK